MNEYKITFYGKAGHGAEPHHAIDTTTILSEFIRKIAKHSDIDIISASSGDAFNVISGQAEATVAAPNSEKIEKIASSLLLYYGEETKFKIEKL